MEDVNKSDEKLVPAAAAAESASALALQEEDVSSSSQELLDTSTSLEESIGASTRTFSRDKLMAAGGSESAQTLQEAHVSSSSEKLINTASLQESITASPPTAACNTSPFRREKTMSGVAEFAQAKAMRMRELELELELELDQFIAEECLAYSSSEDATTTTSPRAMQHHNAIDGGNRRTVRNTADGTLPAASSLGSKILSQCVPHCFYWYYIRMDRKGSFHVYPDRGGPFQSLQEAEDAINRHHDGLWCQSWRDVQAPGGGSYPSTRKNSNVDTYRYLVEALLDQYNEDNNLIGDLAHELDEDTMMEQWIYEDHAYYYHYNFTTKKNEAALGACTFFAEVSHKLGEDALEVNCCCKIEDEDNGWCYGCRNNGSQGMRHPKNSDAYAGGHLDVFLPCTLEEPSSSDDDV